MKCGKNPSMYETFYNYVYRENNTLAKNILCILVYKFLYIVYKQFPMLFVIDQCGKCRASTKRLNLNKYCKRDYGKYAIRVVDYVSLQKIILRILKTLFKVKNDT